MNSPIEVVSNLDHRNRQMECQLGPDSRRLYFAMLKLMVDQNDRVLGHRPVLLVLLRRPNLYYLHINFSSQFYTVQL